MLPLLTGKYWQRLRLTVLLAILYRAPCSKTSHLRIIGSCLSNGGPHQLVVDNVSILTSHGIYVLSAPTYVVTNKDHS